MLDAEKAKALEERVRHFLSRLPPGVELCAVIKARHEDEIAAALDAGVKILGSNYAQETVRLRDAVLRLRPQAAGVPWRFIGHLQSNKVRDLLPHVATVDTVDRLKIAKALDQRAGELGRILPVLVEVNSGREAQKGGVMPEAACEFVASLAPFSHLRIEGLMTMGPEGQAGDALRPYFALTKKAFDGLSALRQSNLDVKTLSMGMSDSWDAAIAEGANLVRLGTALFGPRV